MSDNTESSAEAQREIPDEPEMGAASTTVAPDRDAGRLVTAFAWVMRYGVYLVVAGSLLFVGLVFVFNMRMPHSLQIIGLTAGLPAVTVGRQIDGQTVDLMDGPQMMWLADVDLFDRDGAGVYACPMPRWSEWTIVDSQLWWTTPNLVSGRGADLNAREVAGTWVGLLPDPVLARVLEYLRYNRKQLEPKARKGESPETNSFAIARAATVKTVKHAVWTFGKDALPDDGDALHVEIDSVLEDFDLDGSDSILDEGSTEQVPGGGDPASNPLTDPDQRRK